AAEPREGQVKGTADRQVAGAGHAAQAGLQPQGEQDLEAEGRLAGVSFDSRDAGVKGREVEGLDEVPDGAGVRVSRQRLVERGVGAAVAIHAPVTWLRLRVFHPEGS